MMDATIMKFDPGKEYFTEEKCYITEYINEPDDDSLSIARARVEPGVTTVWHWLKDTAERYVIISGEGKMEIRDTAPVEVGPGDTVLIPPETPQRITNTGREDLIFLCICTPGFRPENYLIDSNSG